MQVRLAAPVHLASVQPLWLHATAAVTAAADHALCSLVCAVLPLPACRIDALMCQLWQQGWMHHLAGHSVACFLTRGDLWCSWEAGQAVFDKYLIDADW